MAECAQFRFIGTRANAYSVGSYDCTEADARYILTHQEFTTLELELPPIPETPLMDVTLDSGQLDILTMTFLIGFMCICFCLGFNAHESGAK